ncbi:hypothetical protein JRI60_22065 [Archangium violaceum]|uniref:hypothetical protein n=1 Tax=Archangium violaceum TaxID=83451 RepID=UPI001951883C|nr:hypothetical protein [Archangium violaceum]QRO01511.1 hypothetical protein JRI60_22065 [Archangium violaceum]
MSRSAFPIHDRSGAGSIGVETSRMRGPKVGVDAKAWGRGIDCGMGALAQAMSSFEEQRVIQVGAGPLVMPMFRRPRG